MALKYAPGLHSHSGGVVLVWHKKSNTLSHSFQTNHHPITITIKGLSSVTTNSTTTMVDVSTTVMLCRCRLAPQLLLELMFQVIADNRLEMLRQRPHNMNRTGGLLPIFIELSVAPAPSTVPPQLMLSHPVTRTLYPTTCFVHVYLMSAVEYCRTFHLFMERPHV